MQLGSNAKFKEINWFYYTKQTFQQVITPFFVNIVFHNFGLAWIVEYKDKLKFNVQELCPYWLCNGPWYNTTISSQLYGH